MSDFFKIILCHAHQHKLELPAKFMRMYGKDLSNVMYVNVPRGVEWRVQLLKQNGRAWLDEGWGEFAKFYSIDQGHFLLFKYEGKSRLHVVIFDTSACEVDYPTQTSNHGCRESPVWLTNDQTCTSEESNVDCLDHGIAGQERKANFLTHNTTGPDDKKSGGVAIKVLSASPSKRVPMRRHKRKLMRDSLGHDGAHADLPMRKIVMALQSERKAGLPIEDMEHKHVGRLKKMEPSNPKVMSSAQRRPVGRPPAKHNAAAHRRPVGRLPAKRNAEGSSAAAVDASGRHASVYPWFKYVMSQHYLNRSPFLPRGFVRKYIKGRSRGIQLQFSGRSWPLWMVTFRKKNLCKFSTGWRAFVRENNLSVGDVCIFELVKSSCFTFNVLIHRC